MNLFSKLFGKKAPAQVEQNTQTLTPTQEMEQQVPKIDQSLFTEDTHPSELFPIHNEESRTKKRSLLEDLKAQNYYSMGKRDGYEDPNFEVMEQNMNLIACDFKEVYAQAIQEMDEQLFIIEKALDPKFESEMPHEYREVIKQKERLEEIKRDLKQQFDMAVLGEGYIEKSVQQYKAGFKKGISLYKNEKLMFQPFNTL
jgi:uncharacterized protein (UPF0335 family)